MTYLNYARQQSQDILAWTLALDTAYINIAATIIILILLGLGWLTLNFIAKHLDQTSTCQELSVCTDTEFVIHPNKEPIIKTLPLFFCICPVLYFLLYILNLTDFTKSYPLVLLIKNILILLLGILILSIAWGLFQLSSNTPIAILNKEGIWLKEYNFIPWDCINTVDTYQVPSTPMEMICIDVLDSKTVYQHAYLSGKMRMIWAKLFRYPPVMISNLTVTNDEVISFAQKYLASRTDRLQSLNLTQETTFMTYWDCLKRQIYTVMAGISSYVIAGYLLNTGYWPEIPLENIAGAIVGYLLVGSLAAYYRQEKKLSQKNS